VYFSDDEAELHGCKESRGAETVTFTIVVIIIIWINISFIVKYLQTIGHGEQITLHFVFIQVIVVKVVIIKVKVVVMMIFVLEAPKVIGSQRGLGCGSYVLEEGGEKALLGSSTFRSVKHQHRQQPVGKGLGDFHVPFVFFNQNIVEAPWFQLGDVPKLTSLVEELP